MLAVYACKSSHDQKEEQVYYHQTSYATLQVMPAQVEYANS